MKVFMALAIIVVFLIGMFYYTLLELTRHNQELLRKSKLRLCAISIISFLSFRFAGRLEYTFLLEPTASNLGIAFLFATILQVVFLIVSTIFQLNSAMRNGYEIKDKEYYIPIIMTWLLIIYLTVMKFIIF